MMNFAALAGGRQWWPPHAGPTLGKGTPGKRLVGLGPMSSYCSTGSLLFLYALYT